MSVHLDCIPCYLRQSLEAARFATDDVAIHAEVMQHVLRMMAEINLDQPRPVVGQATHRKVREITGSEDPYRSAKSRFNRLAVAISSELALTVRRAPIPLQAAVRLAIAANAIDLGVAGSFTEAMACEALRASFTEPLLGDWNEFSQAAADARDILYLADNAGEIGVDKLLIEELGPERVTVVVRGGAVLNDATLADAREVGMQELVEVIDNGSDAPGTILDDCGAPFRERFARASMIIAKGQGNFESLSDVGGNLFFLFKVKCPTVANHVGLPIGAHALLRSRGSRPSVTLTAAGVPQ